MTLAPQERQTRADHRHHRPGRLVPGRAAARRRATRSTASSAAPRTFNTGRIDHLYQDPHEPDVRLLLALRRPDRRVVAQPARCSVVQPDEIYNLGAQSHVSVSFDVPEYTAEVTRPRHGAPARGDPRARASTPRFYQASSSEMFGKAPRGAADARRRRSTRAARTPRPRSYAYWITGQLPRGLRPASPSTASSSTTSRRAAARRSSPARSPARSRASSTGCRTSSSSATSTPSATGASPATTSRRCG